MDRHPLLDAPSVALGAGFVVRLEALARRAAGSRERGELAGRGRTQGAGDELVGHRPYRAGEDVRHLDWALYARLERPFVRVHRQEAGVRWRVLLDTSGSMGLGAPGKLQLGAEVALALAVVGQRFGAVTELLARGPDGRVLRRTFVRRRDLAAWLAALQALESHAGRREGLGELLPLAAAGRRRLARLFVVGDLLDLQPASLGELQRPGRRVVAVQLLAPHELDPSLVGLAAARWADREGGGQLEVGLAGTALAAYSGGLARRAEAWRRSCARHGMGWSSWSSATAFEDVVQGLLGT